VPVNWNRGSNEYIASVPAELTELVGKYELVVTAMHGWDERTAMPGICVLLRRQIHVDDGLSSQYIILSAVVAAVVLALGALLAFQIRAHKEQFKRFIESFLKHEGMLAFKIGWDAWVRPSLPAFAVRCAPRATFASLHRCLQDIGGDSAQTTAVDCGSLAFFAFCVSVRTGVFVTALFCSLQLRSTRTRWERLL
jgi:hypothetical protein